MLVRRLGSFLLAGLLSAGCDSDPSATDGPTAASIAAAGERLASTSGGGKAELPPGFTLLSFSFNASAFVGGDARGQFRQRYVSAGGSVDFQGEVTCISFDPVHHRAWVGGVVTRNRSTNPAVLTAIHQVGRDVWFRVVDNGEGRSQDDRTTVLGFEGAAGFVTSADYCEQQPWAAGDANTWPVVNGNIQVRP